jgi:MFS family permease
MTTDVLPTAAPPQPRRPAFYHAGVNLVLAALAMSATLPGRTHGLGLITKQLTSDPDLGVNRTLFSDLNFWAILLGSALCLPVGWCIDRFGVRAVLGVVALGLGLAVLGMSAATGVVALFLTLTLVRGLGQGALSVVSLAMVGKWFTRRLPVAMGVFTTLLTFGMIIPVMVVGTAAKDFGWRATWAGVGLSLVAVMAPLGVLFARNAPADAAPAGAARKPDQPLAAALRSPAFWAFTLAMCLFNAAWSAVTLFNEDLLEGQMLDHDTFLRVMTVLVAVGLPSNLVAGWVATRWPMGRLLAVGMVLLAGAMVLFPHVKTDTDAVLFGAALGVSGGIITVVWFSVYGRAYGRLHLGSIQAMGQLLSVFASALGPVLLTRSFDWLGSFNPYFYASGAAAVALAVAVWLVRLPSAAERSAAVP